MADQKATAKAEAKTKRDGKLIPVKFLRSYERYNEGETAGFTAEKARQLIEGKVAVAVNR